MYGNEKFLKKALGNAIGNALEHSPASGTVSVNFQKKNGKPVFSVLNFPAYIEEHLPHVYEAFYRAGKETSQGSGLGVYILRMVLETYDIEHTIANCGDGVKFTVEFREASVSTCFFA